MRQDRIEGVFGHETLEVVEDEEGGARVLTAVDHVGHPRSSRGSRSNCMGGAPIISKLGCELEGKWPISQKPSKARCPYFRG